MQKGKLIGKIFGIALVFTLVVPMLGGLSGDAVHATDLDLFFSSAPALAAGENEGGSPAQSALGTIYFTINDPGGGDQPSMAYTHTETYIIADACKLQVCLQDVGVNPSPEPPSWADDIANVYVDGVFIGTYDSVHNRLPYPGPGPVQCFTSDMLAEGSYTITVEIVYSWVAGSMFAGDITVASADTTPPATVSDLRPGFFYPTEKPPNIPEDQRSYGYDGALTYYKDDDGVRYAGWLARGDKGHYGEYVDHYHIGQDIPAEEGDLVYAIADGWIVHVSTGGWGDGNVGLFVKHELNTGDEFLALYGHVKNYKAVGDLGAGWPNVKNPVSVKAGDPFAEIGDFGNLDHLHFGIHIGADAPGFYDPGPQADPQYPRNNIGWGRMGLNRWPDPNGFVDPINWITTRTAKSTVSPASSVMLSWTAPADDGNDVGSGPASEYDIRYSTQEITETNWELATQCMGEPTPGDPGSTDTFRVTDLSIATVYYFALKAYDEAGNPSGLSNVSRGVTAGIYLYLCSPADMIVMDPDGLTISKELNEIPGATYTEIDINGDGDLDDVVNIPDRKIGDYLITVIPELGVSPTDTYTLGVSTGGIDIVLAENVQIGDIPSEGYIVRSTETEIVQIIPATIDFDPDASNLRSKGKYVTAYIELPTGYDVSQIDISDIRLNDTVPALSKPTGVGDYDDDGLPDLMVKFHRTAVQDALTEGEEVEVTITGEVNGIIFEGGDTIRVITAAAAPGHSEWTRVSTPTTEGWVLAPNSVIVDYAVADDGDVAYAILYSYDAGEFQLLKSTDSAATWEDIMDALEEEADGDINWLVAVATDAEDAEFVAVVLEMTDLSVHVFISDDGGATFEDAGEVEDGGVYFPDGYYVSDLEVSPEVDGERDIAIGGRDNYGDAALFRCTVTGDSPGAWEDATDLGDYPGWDNMWPTDSDSSDDIYSLLVTDIIFSPSWVEDKTVLVTTVNDSLIGPDYDVYLQCGSWGTSGGWNEMSTLGIEAVPILEDVDIPMWLADFDARRVAGITSPSDYNSKSTDMRMLWVWVNYYDEDNDPACVIMRVDDDSGDLVGPMGQVEDGELWLTNVSYKGTIAEGEAIAGALGTGGYVSSPDELLTDCCEGVQVYRNDGVRNMDICCIRWADACKPPTGTFAMAVSYVNEDKAYAVSLWGFFSPYDEDAWSVTFDDGDTWNQLSLIDTHIDYLSDVAVSPDCNKAMLVSINEECGCGCDSVWLHAEHLPEAEEYDGKWLRTSCGQLEGLDNDGYEHGILRLPPNETTGDTVYLADLGSNNVYQLYREIYDVDCWCSIASTELDYIVDLVAQDANTVLALDYYGDVAMFDDDEWQEAVDSEVDNGYTIAVWGGHVLVGGQNGDVSYSNDGGETFALLEEFPTIDGYVSVAFDTYFDTNNVIYAALANAGDDNGIYRWVIGESIEWEDLGAEDYAYTGLVLDIPSGGKPKTSSADTGGVLYASYVSGDTTGVARCLTPAEDVCCDETDWGYLTRGLTSELFKMTPQALKICGCLTPGSNSKLFAVDGSEPYDMEKGQTGTVWSFED